MGKQSTKLRTLNICDIALKKKLQFAFTTLFVFLIVCHSSKATDDTLYLYEDDLYDSNYYYEEDYNSALTKYYKENDKTAGNHNSDFVPTVIPLIQSRNLNVGGGQRRSKHFQQNSNNRNTANQFVNQVYNHQQLSSNNVPSTLSNTNNNVFNPQPVFPTIDRVSSINHNVALNVQDHARDQITQNVKIGPNRHNVINRKPTPLQQILQEANANSANNKIVPEPGWIPVTKLSLPKVPLGAAGRPIFQTQPHVQKQNIPADIIQQVILRNKLQQQNRLEELLKKTKLPSIKFPPVSQITGPTPLEPSSTISAAFKKNHARFNTNANNQQNVNNVFLRNQPPTPESNRPVVIVTTVRPNVVKQHSIPITSSSSPSPLIQIVESRSIRPPVKTSHDNSIFPLHLNSRKPHVQENSSPITVYPNDTVLIQYQTTLEKLNTDPKTNTNKYQASKGKRRERATLNIGFVERISLLSCSDEAEDLIREILESPLRKRNALLGILRMKKKEEEREGRKSQQIKQQKSGQKKQNQFVSFPQNTVGTSLNAFTTQQQVINPRAQNNKNNVGSKKNKQLLDNAGRQQLASNKINNNFQSQGQFNNAPNRGPNTNKKINVQSFRGNNSGRSNFQQNSQNRNNNNQQGHVFGGKENRDSLKQTTSASFSIIQTSTARKTTRRPTTTVRPTRRPKNVELTNETNRLPQQPQQRAISAGDPVPAKITVNEQFQHFPAFQQLSKKKQQQQTKPKNQKPNIGQALRGSFAPTTLEKSNFEQAFLTKVPAKQVQKQGNQQEKQAQRQAQKQAQLERARKRLQKQQLQQQRLKQQNNIVGINGQPINTQNQQKTSGGNKAIEKTPNAPQFFIDVPKKPSKGAILQQIQPPQQNNIPRKEKTIRKKKPVFLPGEFTEVQSSVTQQNRSNKNLNKQNRPIQQKPIINTNKAPSRKHQNQKNNNRNKSPRQNFSSDANNFNGNKNGNRNRQPKTVNNGGQGNSVQAKNNVNQIFTTSRPQVTQTFVPKQILPNKNLENTQSQNGSGGSNGNTFTIEQFLKRYPEVKRLSSRFGDGKNDQNRIIGNTKGQNDNNRNNKNGGNKKNGRKGNKRKEGRKSKNKGNNNSNRNNNKKNKPNQANSQQNDRRKQKSINRRPPSKPQTQNIPASTTRPIITTTTRRPIVTTTTTRRPILTTTFVPRTPVPRKAPRKQNQSRPSNQQPKQSTKNQINPIENSVPDVDFPTDQELSSVDYSYLYYQDYYEELVPVHHRFNQLATTTTAKPSTRRPKNQRKKKNRNKNNGNKKNKGGRQGKRNQLQSQGGKNKNKQPQSNSFSFFTFQPQDEGKKKGGNQGNFPNFPSNNGGNGQNAVKPQVTKKVTTRRPVTQAPTPKKVLLKPSKVGEPKEKPVAIKSKDPLQSGPYGYVEKGTFFTDSHVKGFPEMIEVVYQGFVWAMNLYYPDKQKEKHGGVHTILKDKVKRQKIFFKDGDYIVRVSGRASPYNINRLTFYTAKGKKYGPWGDRRSKDSIDFDVSAPPGHGLAHFSGTVDFGVPFRSISFHWKPHE